MLQSRCNRTLNAKSIIDGLSGLDSIRRNPHLSVFCPLWTSRQIVAYQAGRNVTLSEVKRHRLVGVRIRELVKSRICNRTSWLDVHEQTAMLTKYKVRPVFWCMHDAHQRPGVCLWEMPWCANEVVWSVYQHAINILQAWRTRVALGNTIRDG